MMPNKLSHRSQGYCTLLFPNVIFSGHLPEALLVSIDVRTYQKETIPLLRGLNHAKWVSACLACSFHPNRLPPFQVLGGVWPLLQGGFSRPHPV